MDFGHRRDKDVIHMSRTSATGDKNVFPISWISVTGETKNVIHMSWSSVTGDKNNTNVHMKTTITVHLYIQKCIHGFILFIYLASCLFNLLAFVR